jgi:hypothetical protein
MAGKRNRRRVVGGTVTVIAIGTAVLLYFFFRERFAAALVGVVGLLLGAASLLVGIIPLLKADAGDRVPEMPPVLPQPEDSPASRKAGIEVHAGRDAFVAGHDLKIGPDGSGYPRPDFPMTKRQRSGDASPVDEEAGD